MDMRRTLIGFIIGVVALSTLWIMGAHFALTYLAVALYVLALLMIPGYAVGLVLFKDSSPSFRIAASAAVASPIYAVAILLATTLGNYRDTFSSIFSILMIGGSLLFLLRKRHYLSDFLRADRTHLNWTLLMFLFSILLMALPATVNDIPYLRGHSVQETRLPIAPGDQYLPYRFAQILLNGADWKGVNFYGIWQVTDRTPLMGLIAAFVLSSLQVIPPLDWVWNVPSGAFSWNVFQITGCLLDAQVLLSAYLILEKLFGTAKTRLTMPFLAVSAFMIWNTFYTSPKSMAAYFILLSLTLVLERKSIHAGVIAALGFLSHSYVTFYILGFLFLIGRRLRQDLSVRRDVLIFLLSAGLAVAPWFLWSSYLYGHTSSFILYPMTSTAEEATLGSTHVIERFLKAPAALIIWVRIVNIFRTLLPWPLMVTPKWFSEFGWSDILWWPDASTNSMNALLLLTYLFTLPGALSLSLALPAYLAWLRSKSKVIFSSVTLPIIFTTLFFGYTDAGRASLMAQPLVPLLVGGAVSSLNKRIASILFITSVIEYVYFIWMNVYPAHLLLTKISSVSDCILFLGIIVWGMIAARMTLTAFKQAT